MPSAGREQRKAQRLANAQRWGRWLTTAMAQERIEPKELIARANGAIDKGSLSHWMNGDYPASPEGVLTVTRALGRNPIEALRAAGYDVMADELSQAPAPANQEIPPAPPTAPPAQSLADAAVSLLREKGAGLPEEDLSLAEQRILNQVMMIEDYIHAMTELKRRDREPDDTEADGGLGAS